MTNPKPPTPPIAAEREWHIDTSFKPPIAYEAEDGVIGQVHVIEYSAVTRLEAELAEMKTQCATSAEAIAKLGWHIVAERNRAKALLASLEQIRVRSQQYQKCNPSVNAMATEAIATYRADGGEL